MDSLTQFPFYIPLLTATVSLPEQLKINPTFVEPFSVTGAIEFL
jgi:hypothetical protein